MYSLQQLESFPARIEFVFASNPIVLRIIFFEETVFAMELVLSEAKAKRVKQSQRQFLMRPTPLLL
jgi:hypothetical protein